MEKIPRKLKGVHMKLEKVIGKMERIPRKLERILGKLGELRRTWEAVLSCSNTRKAGKSSAVWAKSVLKIEI